MECGQGTRNISEVVNGKSRNRTEICLAEPCPGNDFLNFILYIKVMSDRCIWDTWTSCQYLCGTSRIPKKTKKKISEDLSGDGSCEGQISEDCDKDVPCTGCFFLLTQLNNFHSDPYVCEDWKETEFCSDKCDGSSTKLVTRACFPIQDPLPEEVEPPVLIKPGNRSCNSYSNCTGDNNLNSNQIKKQSHRRTDKMDRLVRVQGQLQPEQGFWIQGKKSISGGERRLYC